MTDNTWGLPPVTTPGRRPAQRRHLFIKPWCPWQNGKAERLNRTLQIKMGLPVN